MKKRKSVRWAIETLEAIIGECDAFHDVETRERKRTLAAYKNKSRERRKAQR